MKEEKLIDVETPLLGDGCKTGRGKGKRGTSNTVFCKDDNSRTRK